MIFVVVVNGAGAGGGGGGGAVTEMAFFLLFSDFESLELDCSVIVATGRFERWDAVDD